MDTTINRLIIGAPFGNHLSFAGTTSTLGTFTLRRRGGLLWRLWRVLRTVRYNWRTQSWVNKLGLPNPGILSVGGGDRSGNIVSVHGFSAIEWRQLVFMAGHNPTIDHIELNLSCPNVGHRVDVEKELSDAVEFALTNRRNTIAKLPPVRWMDFAEPLYKMGVRRFHCCNTIPSPGGGISGKPLMQYGLWAVSELRQRFGGDVDLTGGGGITSVEDVERYVEAGADRCAVGSMLFNPLNWRRIPKMVERLKQLKGE